MRHLSFKRLTALLLAIVMLLPMISIPTFAADASDSSVLFAEDFSSYEGLEGEALMAKLKTNWHSQTAKNVQAVTTEDGNTYMRFPTEAVMPEGSQYNVPIYVYTDGYKHWNNTYTSRPQSYDPETGTLTFADGEETFTVTVDTSKASVDGQKFGTFTYNNDGQTWIAATGYYAACNRFGDGYAVDKYSHIYFGECELYTEDDPEVQAGIKNVGDIKTTPVGISYEDHDKVVITYKAFIEPGSSGKHNMQLNVFSGEATINGETARYNQNFVELGNINLATGVWSGGALAGAVLPQGEWVELFFIVDLKNGTVQGIFDGKVCGSVSVARNCGGDSALEQMTNLTITGWTVSKIMKGDPAGFAGALCIDDVQVLTGDQASGLIKFNDYVNDFESANVGDTIPGMTGINAAYKIADLGDEHGKVWALGNSDEGTGARDQNARLSHEMFTAEMDDHLTITADYYIPTGAQGQFQTQFLRYTGIVNGAVTDKTWADIFVIRSKDGVATIGREGNPTMASVPYDTWFTVAVEFTMSKNTYDIYIDGALVIADQQLHNGQPTAITAINAAQLIMGKQNKAADSFLSGTWYLDNITMKAGEYEGRIVCDEHKFIDKVAIHTLATKATCTEPAYYHYSCVCGLLSEEVFAYGEALGHAWGDGMVAEDGSIVYTCNQCGESYSEQGHEHAFVLRTPSADTLALAATCNTPAYYYYTCSCGAIGEETYASGSPLAHAWDNGVITTPPTETEDGIKTYICGNCGETYTETVVYTDPIGYVMDFEQFDDGASITEGFLTMYSGYYVKDIDGNKVWEMVPGVKLDDNHRLTNAQINASEVDKFTLRTSYYFTEGTGTWLQTQIQRASLITDGTSALRNWLPVYDIYSRDGVFHIKSIGGNSALTYDLTYDQWFTVTVEFTMSDATFDFYVDDVLVAEDVQFSNYPSDSYEYINANAFIIAKESKTVSSFAAGCVYIDDITLKTGECGIEAHRHSFTNQNVDESFLRSWATCTAPATYFYSCECGAVGEEFFEFGEPNDHEMSEWTCSEAGEHIRYCFNGCGYTEVGEHSYTLVDHVKPNCGTNGYDHYACSCGSFYDKLLPATKNHKWDNGVDDGIGTITYTCGVCGEIKEEYYDVPEVGTLVIFGSAQTANVGDTVTVVFDIIENPGVSGLVVTPRYDENALKLISTEAGYVFEDCTMGKNLVFSNTGDTYECGKLVIFTFEVLTEGEIIVELIARECANGELQIIPVTVHSAVITAYDFIYGDANGDGIVNLRDAILLRNYLAAYDYDTGMADVEVAKGADANGDGRINLMDSILLMNYLAAYDYDTGMSDVVLGPKA